MRRDAYYTLISHITISVNADKFVWFSFYDCQVTEENERLKGELEKKDLIIKRLEEQLELSNKQVDSKSETIQLLLHQIRKLREEIRQKDISFISGKSCFVRY